MIPMIPKWVDQVPLVRWLGGGKKEPQATCREDGGARKNMSKARLFLLALNIDFTVRSTKQANLQAKDWTTNGAGFNIRCRLGLAAYTLVCLSHAFGFGLMDAGEMVRKAKIWQGGPKQVRLFLLLFVHNNPGHLWVWVQRSRGDCACGTEENTWGASLWVFGGEGAGARPRDCRYIIKKQAGRVWDSAHVAVGYSLAAASTPASGQLYIRWSYTSWQYDISISISYSPYAGFANFRTWPLMSTHYWGENPAGK